MPGVADLGIVKSGEVPQIQVKPDREALARYGLDLGDFQHVFQTALGGRPVGRLLGRRARASTWCCGCPLAARDDVEKIRKLRIPVRGRRHRAARGAGATSSVGVGRAAITRENGQRYIGIRMNVRGRDLGSFVDEARGAASRATAPLPHGHDASSGAASSRTRSARWRGSRWSCRWRC